MNPAQIMMRENYIAREQANLRDYVARGDTQWVRFVLDRISDDRDILNDMFLYGIIHKAIMNIDTPMLELFLNYNIIKNYMTKRENIYDNVTFTMLQIAPRGNLLML